MKLIIQIVLWLLIIFLGYKLYNSVIGPVEFNKKKTERYKAVISNLKDIKSAQAAFREIEGNYAGDFDKLVRFIDTAQFAITTRRDTSFADQEKNKAYGLDPLKGGYYTEAIIIDTISFTPVKDSLFGATDRYKTMMNVPVEGVSAKFELKADKLEKNGLSYSVYEAKVDKNIVLDGLDKDLVIQERQVNSVDGVNGPYVKVGSLNEINTSGNWPKIFDTDKQN